MEDNKNKFIGFMAHLSITEYDYLEEVLQEYDCGYYLIGYEAEPYNHYHFLCQMSLSNYHNFTKRVFTTKYKLRGKAIKGHSRQYGKIKEIHDIEKLKSYTIKDGNYRSNMSEEDVKKIFDNSHKKETLKLQKDKMIDYIGSFQGDPKTKIIKYCLAHDVDITASKLKSFYNYYLAKTTYLTETDKILKIKEFNNFL